MRINRIIGGGLCLLASCLLFVACINDKEVEQGGIELQVGDRIPAFSVRMNDGRIMTAADLKESISLIVFFHTDCKDCRQELPVIQRVYDDYAGRITLLCISRAEKESDISSYWAEQGFTLPYSAQENRDVYHLFAKSGIPRIYVVDKNLIIQSIFTDNALADYEKIVEAIPF